MKRLLDTEVRYFDQDSFNIPKLENRWGCMVDLLDFVLIQNTSDQDINSIVTVNDSTFEDRYWLTTLFLNKNHGLKANLSVIEIYGSEELVYNDIFRVQEVTETTATIAFDKKLHPIQPTDINSSVHAKFKLSSLGYEKTFEGFQKAVYKSETKKNKVCYLRVDNSCPSGYDPSFSKFSRVSMFSEIDSIDDYNFKLGRLKAPSPDGMSGNYTKNEDGIFDIWFNTSKNGVVRYGLEGTSTLNSIPNFCIIGDKSTFYIHLYNVMDRDSARLVDTTYSFGEYEKLIYKEDPYPFILRTSEQTSTASLGSYFEYTARESFQKDSSYGKHTFTTETENDYTTEGSDKWSLMIDSTFLTGDTTGINFKPYKNELALNIFPMYLKIYRRDNVVLEGILKGIYNIFSNLQDTYILAPKNKDIIFNSDIYYLALRSADYYTNNSVFLIKLNDWS